MCRRKRHARDVPFVGSACVDMSVPLT